MSLTDTQKKTLDLLIKSSATKGFYLAGGTALYLKYHHRISEDFDFFTYPDVDFSILQLQKKIEGIPAKIEHLLSDEDTLIVLINDIKFSFFSYKYPLLKPTIRLADIPIDIASDEDIACMKVVAIAQRGSKKDFYDLWFLMKRHNWSLKYVIELAKTKYPTLSIGVILKSIIYFEDAEKESYEDIDKKWSEIKEFFVGEGRLCLKENKIN
jgi:predicted nucleotidyltransferase component of viral defense system